MLAFTASARHSQHPVSPGRKIGPIQSCTPTGLIGIHAAAVRQGVAVDFAEFGAQIIVGCDDTEGRIPVFADPDVEPIVRASRQRFRPRRPAQ